MAANSPQAALDGAVSTALQGKASTTKLSAMLAEHLAGQCDVDVHASAAHTHTEARTHEDPGSSCAICDDARARLAGLRAPTNLGGALFAIHGIRTGAVLCLEAAVRALAHADAASPVGKMVDALQIQRAFEHAMRVCLDVVMTNRQLQRAHAPLARFAQYLQLYWPSVDDRRALASVVCPPLFRRESLEQLLHITSASPTPLVVIATAPPGPSVATSSFERVVGEVARVLADEGGRPTWLHLPFAVWDLFPHIPAQSILPGSAAHSHWQRSVLACVADAPDSDQAAVEVTIPCATGASQSISITCDNSWNRDEVIADTISSHSRPSQQVDLLWDAATVICSVAGRMVAVLELKARFLIQTAHFGTAAAEGLLAGAAAKPRYAAALQRSVQCGAHLGNVKSFDSRTHAPLIAVLRQLDCSELMHSVLEHLVVAPAYHDRSVYVGMRACDGAASLSREAALLRGEVAFDSAEPDVEPDFDADNNEDEEAVEDGGEDEVADDDVDEKHGEDEDSSEAGSSERQEAVRKCSLTALIQSSLPQISSEVLISMIEDLAVHVSRCAHRAALLLRLTITELLGRNAELPDLTKDRIYLQVSLNALWPNAARPTRT